MLTDFFMIEDAAAVIENMLLAATALGYGSFGMASGSAGKTKPTSIKP
jgi:nitroreductase